MKKINSDSCNINETALAANINDIKIDKTTLTKPVKLIEAPYKGTLISIPPYRFKYLF